MEQAPAGVRPEGMHLPVGTGGGPGAGAPALAKDELICVHRALMPSLSLAPGGSISGTGKSGRVEIRGQALFLTLMPSGGPLPGCVGRWVHCALMAVTTKMITLCMYVCDI